MKRPLSSRRRRNRRATLIVLAVAIAAVGLTWALGGFTGAEIPSDIGHSSITRDLDRSVPADHPRIVFAERARDLGVNMVHGTGARTSLLPEDMGPGVALEDLDGDGDLDLFFVNLCGPVGAGSSRTVKVPATRATHRLYRNDEGKFTDVTSGSGVEYAEYGIGVAAGDADGDGRIDIYVTCYGRNRLLKNLGDLKFEDVTLAAGVGDDGFGAGAAFGDADGDGDLDLYVCNYVEFSWSGEKQTASDWGGYSLPYTINPSSFPPAPNRYYRNRGDGSFDECAVELGIESATGRSLGVTLADFSGDGRPDIYVLNDISDNAYFESQGDGQFKDRSIDCLAADPRGAMGNAVADLEGDGDLDIFITHWIAQENGLYVNLYIDPRGQRQAPVCEFMDEAERFGLGQISNDFVGWGAAFLDYDLDGALDLAVVNGSTMEEEGDQSRLVPQRPQLFWNKPGKGFFDVGPVSGELWMEDWNARGLAEGDLDQDGDLDLVVVSNRGPARILIHQGAAGHWLRIRLTQPGANRFGVGAHVRVEAQGRTCMQAVGAGTSYLSHRPLELTFGLGTAEKADRIVVTWPDGKTTTLTDTAGDQALTIRQVDDGK